MASKLNKSQCDLPPKIGESDLAEFARVPTKLKITNPIEIAIITAATILAKNLVMGSEIGEDPTVAIGTIGIGILMTKEEAEI